MRIDCKPIAQCIKNKMRDSKEVKPTFVIFQVGDNPASNAYVRGKLKDCAEVGIKAVLEKFPEDVSYEDFAAAVSEGNYKYDAAMIQLPLPPHLVINELMWLIDKEKDVDGMRPDSCFIPATPKGICLLMDYLGYSFDGKKVVMIGRSDIVGKPMAKLALEKNATVTVCHSHTNEDDLILLCNTADIIISAVGKQDFVKEYMIHPVRRQLILDVGINRGEDGKLHGDVDSRVYDMENVDYTPVPGGIGLMTRVGLLDNLMQVKGKGKEV